MPRLDQLRERGAQENRGHREQSAAREDAPSSVRRAARFSPMGVARAPRLEHAPLASWVHEPPEREARQCDRYRNRKPRHSATLRGLPLGCTERPTMLTQCYVRRYASSFDSSISVTSAAIAERSDRVSVMCANSAWPLSVSITDATPSCRPTRRLSRWATSCVSTTREF